MDDRPSVGRPACPLRASVPETGTTARRKLRRDEGRRGTACHGRTAAKEPSPASTRSAADLRDRTGPSGLTLVAWLRQAGLAVPAVVVSPGSAPTPPPTAPPVGWPTRWRGPTSSGSPCPTTRSRASPTTSPGAGRRRSSGRSPRSTRAASARSTLLAPLRGLVAGILALHPLQSFAAPGDADTLRDVPMAVTGDTAADIELGPGSPSGSAAVRSRWPTRPSPSITWPPPRRATSSSPCRARPAS